MWERSLPAELGSGVPEPEHPGETPQHIRRTGEIVPMKMTDYGIFAATERVDVPYAFLIDASAINAIANLRTHGIVVEKLSRDAQLDVEQFEIRGAKMSEREFQGHHEVTMTGKWKKRSENIKAATFLVRMNQPLARLAFYLVEPRSDDGLFDWNFFDDSLEAEIAPVRRIMKPVAIDATIIK